MERGQQIWFGFSNHEVCSHFLKIKKVKKKIVGNSSKRRENKILGMSIFEGEGLSGGRVPDQNNF